MNTNQWASFSCFGYSVHTHTHAFAHCRLQRTTSCVYSCLWVCCILAASLSCLICLAVCVCVSVLCVLALVCAPLYFPAVCLVIAPRILYSYSVCVCVRTSRVLLVVRFSVSEEVEMVCMDMACMCVVAL